MLDGHLGLALPGLPLLGLAPPGVASPGLAPLGLAPPGTAPLGLAPPDLALPGLVPPGLVPTPFHRRVKCKIHSAVALRPASFLHLAWPRLLWLFGS